jgi:hypothetical protein
MMKESSGGGGQGGCLYNAAAFMIFSYNFRGGYIYIGEVVRMDQFTWNSGFGENCSLISPLLSRFKAVRLEPATSKCSNLFCIPMYCM